MNKITENKIVRVAFSIIVAVLLWLYVVSTVNQNSTVSLSNVPITLLGEEVLESRGHMLIFQSMDTVDLRFNGQRSSLVKLTRENVSVSVDVSALEEGAHTLRCSIVLPAAVSTGTVSVEKRDSHMLTVHVDKRSRKTIPVRGEFSGTIAEGYQGQSFSLSPSTLDISGPEDVVDRIDHAVATLDMRGMKDTFSGLKPYRYVDAAGTEIRSKLISCDAKEIYMIYPVVMAREVELKVELLPGGGAAGEHVTCEIRPGTIQVSGRETKVGGLDELILGTIDLSRVVEEEHFTFPIRLEEGLTNESGVTEAEVTLSIHGLATHIYKVDQIELTNIPEGYHAESVTTALQVSLRGPREAVDRIRPEQIRVTADLSELTASTGRFRVPAVISLTGEEEVGVLDLGYTVSVHLTK